MTDPIHGPAPTIETINRLVRTSQQMLLQNGRRPTPDELAERLAMPPEKVNKLLEIAMIPVRG